MIGSISELRALHATPSDRALGKQLAELDEHCRQFIALSPFVVLASASADGRHDASPRGGKAGFVRCVNAQTLWLPDAPGNNRLDTLANVIETGRLGLLFLIPGVDETLRVNGAACVRADGQALEAFGTLKHAPKVVVEVAVEEAYLHCAKALMRSSLWSGETRIERDRLPTIGKMINDQLGVDGPAETRDQMLARYAKDL